MSFRTRTWRTLTTELLMKRKEKWTKKTYKLYYWITFAINLFLPWVNVCVSIESDMKIVPKCSMGQFSAHIDFNIIPEADKFLIASWCVFSAVGIEGNPPWNIPFTFLHNFPAQESFWVDDSVWNWWWKVGNVDVLLRDFYDIHREYSPREDNFIQFCWLRENHKDFPAVRI